MVFWLFTETTFIRGINWNLTTCLTIKEQLAHSMKYVTTIKSDGQQEFIITWKSAYILINEEEENTDFLLC